MAKRPIFIPDLNSSKLVREELIDFQWYPGFAKVQVQKSIASLHESAAKKGISPVLEISSKSTDKLGISLSAFNLIFEVQGNQRMSVECAYQGSKVFDKGGPYTELYSASSKEAKTDERLKTSGKFIAYSFFNEEFPTQPMTAFYDWLYLTALWQNRDLAEKLLEFKGFSDIVFNPQNSINCQAHSAALFISLYKKGEIENVLKDRDYYFDIITNKKLPSSTFTKQVEQLNLFSD
jgi:hypothetical protein